MRRILLALILLLYTTGCAPQLAFHIADADGHGARNLPRAMTAAPHTGPMDGLQVHTHTGGTLLFPENEWTLTLEGIRGNAHVTHADGTQYSADTTLSYLDASAAASTGRSSTMGQFMLTILGVILVLGLAAIILYAAFLATAR